MSTNVITIISECNFANQRIVVKIASAKYVHTCYVFTQFDATKYNLKALV